MSITPYFDIDHPNTFGQFLLERLPFAPLYLPEIPHHGSA